VTSPSLRVVVADANVLINLMHVARLRFCGELPGLEVVVPDHVREEIIVPEQRAMLDQAMADGLLKVASITEPEDIALFAGLTTHLGRGEAACLVLAVRNGWTVASDEKRRFRREAVSRIGTDRIIGTVDFYKHAIRAGLVTIDEADTDKAALEGLRFKMPFESFREKVQDLQKGQA
jgi:predicted nucleic acid-binding protein